MPFIRPDAFLDQSEPPQSDFFLPPNERNSIFIRKVALSSSRFHGTMILTLTRQVIWLHLFHADLQMFKTVALLNGLCRSGRGTQICFFVVVVFLKYKTDFGGRQADVSGPSEKKLTH